MTPDSPVIHVIDDDASFLAAVTRWLRAEGFAVETYSSADDFLSRPRPAGAGCIITDLRMPGTGGLDLQAALASAPERWPVLFLSAHGDVPTTVRAMKQGAEDFLIKSAPREELLAAIARALDRDARDRTARTRTEALKSRLDALTPREREVLLLVVKGKLNKEIAADLSIHERTVKLHRTALTRKLGVRSVAELTLLARDAGLLP